MKRKIIRIVVIVVVILALGFIAHELNLLGLIKSLHGM